MLGICAYVIVGDLDQGLANADDEGVGLALGAHVMAKDQS